MGQAAAVATKLRATMPHALLEDYVDIDYVSSELARRALPSAAERFHELFVEGWRNFWQLDDLWPEEVDGHAAAADAAALAAVLGVGESAGLTEGAASLRGKAIPIGVGG